MRRTLIALALALATANPTAAQSTVVQPKPKCRIARMTLLGAAVGFGAGALIAFPVPLVGQNIFEDTGNETAPWATLIGLTVVGAAIGNVLARRNCATTSPSIATPNVLLSETDVQWLAQTVRLKPTGRETQWMRPSVSTAAMSADSGIPSAEVDAPGVVPRIFRLPAVKSSGQLFAGLLQPACQDRSVVLSGRAYVAMAKPALHVTEVDPALAELQRDGVPLMTKVGDAGASIACWHPHCGVQRRRFTLSKQEDDDMTVVPISSEADDAERKRIRTSNDRDQEMERHGEQSQHNRGYDDAADGIVRTPAIVRVVDE